jgi:phospholipid/cholesterol/gamma-HCH transport system substrate-binding protein
MNITPTQKIKTGGFVLASLFLLCLIIYVIGKQKKLFGNVFSVYTNFKNVAGTREGNFVRFAGINIGTVDNIALINDTTVRLLLSLDKSVQAHLKNDAIATIGSDGLMGDKLIIIHPGRGGDSSTPLKNGETLASVNPVDVDRIMNNLGRVSANAESITTGLASIVEKINNGEGSLGKMLNDDKMARKLEGTIDKASATVTSIKKTANSVNDNMEAAKSSILLRGYFRKKERKRIKDSIDNAAKINPDKKQTDQ